MAFDRFVIWNGKGPEKEHIKEVLEDFLNGISSSIEWVDENTLIATLIGTGSSMFRRHGGKLPYREERWIEVYVIPKSIDVITRMQDDLTNALAHEFATRCAMFWDGKLEY